MPDNGIEDGTGDMLHSIKVFSDASIRAADGEIGKVSDFYFDDLTWMVRYLVVDPGSWLTPRKVLIAVTAIGDPDWERRVVPVRLTKEQVRHAPDVDTEKPVSRQQEIAMSRYFGWPTYWSPRVPSGLYTAAMEYPTGPEDNPHLRSVWAIAGYSVWAPEGEVGCLDDFIMDDAGWHIGYLVVKTGSWLSGHNLLVSTSGVRSISWGNRRLDLARSRAAA
ncbi:MAG TPA: PRC-barrel domain-containing protein [Bryobacteraceae bacterium]